MKSILLFITNIRHYHDRMNVAPVLNELVGEDCWFVDLSDTDKVLRVEADADKEPFIIVALEKLGFCCNRFVHDC